MLIVSNRPIASGGSQERRLTYQVRDSVAGTQVNALAARDAVLAIAPDEVDGFPYVDWRYSTTRGTLLDVELEYGNTSSSRPEPSVGEAQYIFRTSLESVRIFSSIETVSSHVDASQAPTGVTEAPDFGRAIAVDAQGRPQGTTIQIPVTRFQYRFRVANNVLSGPVAGYDNYELLVEDLTGKVASTEFKGRPAGSVRFDGANETARLGSDTTITFDFTRRPNLTDVQVGNITIPSVDGWDYVWPYFIRTRDTAQKMVQPRPAYLYVERNYPRADLNDLGIP